MNETERLIILNMIEDLGSIRAQNLFKHFGSFSEAFKASESELRGVKEIGSVLALRIVKGIREVDLKKEMGLVKRNKVKIITFLDKEYPENLRDIYGFPVVLYVKGDIIPEDKMSIAIVGSRLASFYGLETSERFGFELAVRGVTIVSGLARGIDSASHKGALKAKGRTLAVLGSGLANIYPEENKRLTEDIAESGAVISEFPMSTIPDRGNFPKRNRIISGLSLGVVCVEAREKSGALITCDLALEQGREVFAVPGKVNSPNSIGTHKLIKQGAKLVSDIEDILEELNLSDIRGKSNCGAGKLTAKLDKDENLVYNLLSNEPLYIDDICCGSGLPLAKVSKALLNLEIKKFVKQLQGKNFVKY